MRNTLLILALILTVVWVTRRPTIEGISGGVEAQLGAAGGMVSGRGSPGGRIVPANAAWSNIDAYGGANITGQQARQARQPQSQQHPQSGLGYDAGSRYPATQPVHSHHADRGQAEAQLRYRAELAEQRATRAEAALRYQQTPTTRGLIGWLQHIVFGAP